MKNERIGNGAAGSAFTRVSGRPVLGKASAPQARVRRVAWERVTMIDELIRAGKYPNCVGMAREFGVSVRTLKRDIEFMQNRQGLPIKYDQRRWGFYYEKARGV